MNNYCSIHIIFLVFRLSRISVEFIGYANQLCRETGIQSRNFFKLTVVPPTVEATISVKDVTVIDTPACLRASPI